MLRTQRPAFSNTSQNEEIEAHNIEKAKRENILNQIAVLQNRTFPEFILIGELQGSPIGDRLYSKNGNLKIDLFYMETEFGKPWIIIGNSETEKDFLEELYDDDELLSLKPIGKLKKIPAIFITEDDVKDLDHLLRKG